MQKRRRPQSLVRELWQWLDAALFGDAPSSDPTGRRETGQSAEDLAASYLQAKGYQILERNYVIGRGELDLIALQGDRLIIVEVKSGQEDEAFLPRQRVNPAKQRQLLKLTQAYRKEQRLLDRHVRIDVVEVVFGGKGRLQINHLEGEVTDPGWR